jgi:hypothetical protein
MERSSERSLMQRSKTRELAFMLADSSSRGTTTVWRIEDFSEAPIPEAEYGQFYGGDSYIVKHVYEQDRREVALLYYWLGTDSSLDERGAAALITTRMDDELGGAATQIRVVQVRAASRPRGCSPTADPNPITL